MKETFEPLKIPETRSAILEVLEEDDLNTPKRKLAETLASELRGHPQHLMDLMQMLAQSSYKAWQVSKNSQTDSSPLLFPQGLSSAPNTKILKTGEAITETFLHKGAIYKMKISYDDNQFFKVYVFDSAGKESATLIGLLGLKA